VPDRVSVEYLDPRTGGIRQADMFVSDRSCSLKFFTVGDGYDRRELWEIGFKLCEY